MVKPLPDGPAVLGPALSGPEHTAREIPAASCHDRFSHRCVESIARDSERTDRDRPVPQIHSNTCVLEVSCAGFIRDQTVWQILQSVGLLASMPDRI